MAVVNQPMRSALDRVLDALHYPVSRASAHFYAGAEDEIARLLRMIRRHARPDAVVADLGCGRATYAIPGNQLCRLLVGVDVTPKIAENPWVGCKVRGDLYHLPLETGSVDLAIARYVLEHLDQPVNALREIARVLRPGGKIVLLTPNRRHYVCLIARLTPHWFHRWFLARHNRFDADVSPTLYRANTPRRLREVASQAGFRVAELELFEAPPGYLGWFWLAYLFGVAYERLVNRFEFLSGLRVSMIAQMEKTPTERPAAEE